MKSICKLQDFIYRVAMLYFMSLAQGSCAVAIFFRESRSNNMSTLLMLMNMAAKGNVNVNNLVQTIVQHPAFRETINSILTATNQEQFCLLLRLKSRSTRGASHHPAFMGNCLIISHTCYRLVLLVVGVNQEM